MAITAKKAQKNTTHTQKKAVARRGAFKLISSPRGGKMLALRFQLKLNRDIFARMLPVSPRSLATIESGEALSEAVTRRLTELQRIVDALSEVMSPETIGAWMTTPNDAFDGLKPLEVIERGEVDRIWQMIFLLRSGVPG
jgi:DNA-binding transcriptional regulator YiaG